MPPGRNEGFFKVIINLVRVLFTPFFRIDVEGLKNLPRDRAFILLSKHQRWEDIPLLSLATPRPLYYIAKYELFKNALSGRFFSALGGIPLNRRRPLESRRYLKATIELLEKGEGVVIFPEGTYYRNKMGPGQTGMVRFVQFCAVPSEATLHSRRHQLCGQQLANPRSHTFWQSVSNRSNFSRRHFC
jgi:1-acyl-sn-glycerol-3-phosphate acyltransferase